MSQNKIDESNQTQNDKIKNSKQFLIAHLTF